MPAILVECLFADSSDAYVYNSGVIESGLVSAESDNWNLGWNKNEVGWWYCTNIENKYYYISQNDWINLKINL